MIDVMLDLETMGSGPDAAIVAIGAVLFDDVDGTIGPSFYEVVDLQSSVRLGGVIDASTVMWWLRQSADARAGIEQSEAKSLLIVLAQFRDWLPSERVRMWGNGASFDNVILASAYRRAGMPHSPGATATTAATERSRRCTPMFRCSALARITTRSTMRSARRCT